MKRIAWKIIGLMCATALLLYFFSKREVNQKIFAALNIESANRKQKISEKKVNSLRQMKSISSEYELVSKSFSLNSQNKFKPQLLALNDSESKIFAKTAELSTKFFDWGSLSPTELDTIRTLAWELGERGIAQFANTLNNASDLDIQRGTFDNTQNNTQLSKHISQIDALRYFAQTNFGESREAIRFLATRPIDRDSEGKILDSVKTGITLEAFQLCTLYETAGASEFAERKALENRPLYAYNFRVGKKLAKFVLQ